jgi:hypothetical protein
MISANVGVSIAELHVYFSGEWSNVAQGCGVCD